MGELMRLFKYERTESYKWRLTSDFKQGHGEHGWHTIAVDIDSFYDWNVATGCYELRWEVGIINAPRGTDSWKQERKRLEPLYGIDFASFEDAVDAVNEWLKHHDISYAILLPVAESRVTE